jgi:hypothetical protein
MPHHAHSLDRWDDATGSNLYEHLAGVNDFLLARARFAGCGQTPMHPAQEPEHLRLAVRCGARRTGLTSSASR